MIQKLQFENIKIQNKIIKFKTNKNKKTFLNKLHSNTIKEVRWIIP